MLGLGELKQTKVYQEALEEGIEEGERRGRLQGKLESVPQLLALGLTVEQISQALDLDVEQVRQAASRSQESENHN